MKITRREILEKWWLIPVLSATGFFAWFARRSYNILLAKPNVSAAKFLDGPTQKIATISEFTKIGTTREFLYSRKIGDQETKTPSVIVRTKTKQAGGLNLNGSHFIALSKICTHLYCESKIIVDPEIASLAYKYRPPEKQPIIGCNCHFSAFDPELAGKSVSGPALKPLPRLRLLAKNGELFVNGIEVDTRA